MNEQSAIYQPEEKSGKIFISSFTELFKGTLKIYKEGFWKFIALSLIPFLGSLPVLIVLFIYYISKSYLTGPAQITAFIILGILGVLAILLAVYVSLSAQAGFKLLLKNFDSRPAIKETFRAGRLLAWDYFLVSLLMVVFILLWSFLFIIPGIIFAIYYGFSQFALVLENQRKTSSLKRSKELVKGCWWAVVGRNILLGLVIIAVYLVLSAPLAFFKEGTLAAAIWNIALGVYRFLAGQVFIIYSFLIYKDLMKMKGEQKPY